MEKHKGHTFFKAHVNTIYIYLYRCTYCLTYTFSQIQPNTHTHTIPTDTHSGALAGSGLSFPCEAQRSSTSHKAKQHSQMQMPYAILSVSQLTADLLFPRFSTSPLSRQQKAKARLIMANTV